MVFEQKLRHLLGQAVKKIANVDLPSGAFSLQQTDPDFEGSHTIVLFPLIKICPQPIPALGKAIGDFFVAQGEISSYEVVKGFLNLTLSEAAWQEALHAHVTEKHTQKNPQKIIIEIACPNTNKPLHLGHLRNTFLGDAMANMLSYLGHKVTKINHVNDRGIHICKSMYAYKHDPQALTPAEAGKKGDHFVGHYYVAFNQQYKQEVTELSKQLGDKEKAAEQAPCMRSVQQMLQAWEKGDAQTLALWRKMNQWVYEGFHTTYRQLNITFDKSYYESEVYLLGKKVVEEGLKRSLFYQKEDGSIWVDLTEEKLGHKLLLRADGTSVYVTQDLGTADLREKDYHPDQSIYVVGDEQKHHFAVLFATIKKLNRAYADKLLHVPYALIDLPSGKMKSREGTVVDADSIIQKMVTLAKAQSELLGKVKHFTAQELKELHHLLAIGGLKFFLLKISPQKRMCFDPQKSIDFLGYTAAFVQYSYARIATMLHKAEKLPIDYQNLHKQPLLDPIEKKLIKQIVAMHDTIAEAAHTLNPSLCAQYFYHLAKTYNQFYTQLPILRAKKEQKQSFRLYLSWCTKQNLSKIARILNIPLTEKM